MKTAGTVLTQDKIQISYEHNKNGFSDIIIVCPGFFNSKKSRWIQKTVQILNAQYDTLVFDFRGQGESSGKFSWSAYEYKDLIAIHDHVASLGYKNIGILGYSLGAASSINAAGEGLKIKSMILISSPTSFWEINYHFWEPQMFEELKDNIECNWEGKGAKVDSLFIKKPKPIERIKKIKNIALLFIHGNKDWIIKETHSERLYDAASGNKQIQIIKNGLHAEKLLKQFPEKMERLLLDWFDKTMK